MEKEGLYCDGVQITFEEWSVLTLVNMWIDTGETLPNHLSEAHAVILKDIEDRKNIPSEGDICVFWDSGVESVIICKFNSYNPGFEYPYRTQNDVDYTNCVKVTDQSTIDLYNKIKES